MLSNNTIHVVDDDADLRHSTCLLLGASGYEARGYDSAESVLSLPDEQFTGCIVTDVCMPGMSGMDLMLRLQRRKLSLPVIVITGHADVRLAVEAMKAGAFDFLSKPFDPETLLDAVRQGLRATRIPTASLKLESSPLVSHLTRREVDVLKGIAAGSPNKAIAHELGISIRTVEAYRSKLLLKLNAKSTADLVRMAVKAGLDDADAAKKRNADQ